AIEQDILGIEIEPTQRVAANRLTAALANNLEFVARIKTDIAGWQRWQCMVNVGEQGARIHANGPRTRTLADVKAMLWRIETAAADRVGPAGLVSDLLEMLVDLATERG